MSIENQPNIHEASQEDIQPVETQSGEKSLNEKYSAEDMSQALAEFGAAHNAGQGSPESILNAHLRTLKNFEGFLDSGSVDLDEDDLKMIQDELDKYPESPTGSGLKDHIASESRAILIPIRNEMQESLSAQADAQKAEEIRKNL